MGDVKAISGRYVVFVCAAVDHAMRVGYTEDEYEQCAVCGAALTPVEVVPVTELERLREALRFIVSCDKVVDRDVVDIAQKALNG